MAISGQMLPEPSYPRMHQQNRGACQQNCRHAYEVTDKETGQALLIDNEYIMS